MVGFYQWYTCAQKFDLAIGSLTWEPVCIVPTEVGVIRHSHSKYLAIKLLHECAEPARQLVVLSADSQTLRQPKPIYLGRKVEPSRQAGSAEHKCSKRTEPARVIQIAFHSPPLKNAADTKKAYDQPSAWVILRFSKEEAEGIPWVIVVLTNEDASDTPLI